MTIATKLRQFLKAAACLAGITAIGSTSAQAALNYSDGDIFVCFRATGGQGALTDYMVNVGPATQFTNAAGELSLALGSNALSDLQTIFGSDWHSRPDVNWSVSGTQFAAGNGYPNRTMFASRAELIPGSQSTAWSRVSLNGSGTPALKIQAMGNAFATGTVVGGQTESGTQALIQPTTSTNSYRSFMPGGANTTGQSSYAQFVSGSVGIENTFANGANNSVLDFYRLEPGSGPAPLVGAFRLNTSAQLTFNPSPSAFTVPVVKLSASTGTVNEDDASGKITLTIERSGKLDAALTVNFSTVDGTAFDGVDFTGQIDTPISFAANETSKTVDVSIIDVPGYSGNRTFKGVIAIAAADGIAVDPKEATITIVETDPQPSTVVLSAATYSIAENGGNLTVTLNRSGVTTTAVDVSVSTANGTALAGTDFTGLTNSVVSFAANDVTKTVDIPITNRAGFFGDRQFTVSLSNGTNGATFGTPSSATVTIQELDPQPATLALSAPTYTVAENGGNAVITINRTGSTAAVSVNFSTSDGTAVGGTDFTAQTNTLVDFAQGETSKNVSVAIINRAGFAGNRAFTVALSSPSGIGQLGTPVSATVNITETDPVPAVTIVPGSYNGLIIPSGTASHNTSGSISLKVTPVGTFTGKVSLGGFSFSLKGTLATTGDAKFGKDATATVPLVGKGKTPVVLGNLALHLEAGKLTGAIGTTSTVDGDRAFYDGKTNVVSSDFLLTNKGKFTVVIPSETVSAALPQGDGVGLVTVTSKGAAKFAGVLADGTKFTASGALSQANRVSAYALLYAKKGSFAGAFTLNTALADSDLSGADFLWIRPVQTKVKSYLAGWPDGTKVDVLGAKYVVPAKAENKSVFPFPNGSGVAVMTFADGKLTGPLNKNVSISSANKVANSPSTTDKTYKLAITSSSGALKGDFTHSDGTKTKFTGVIFQKGATKGGYGYFLSNMPKNGAPGESGGVTILAQ